MLTIMVAFCEAPATLVANTECKASGRVCCDDTSVPKRTKRPPSTTTSTSPAPPADRRPDCPGSCIVPYLSFTCFRNAEMTDVFKCKKSGTQCCAPKSKVQEVAGDRNDSAPQPAPPAASAAPPTAPPMLSDLFSRGSIRAGPVVFGQEYPYKYKQQRVEDMTHVHIYEKRLDVSSSVMKPKFHFYEMTDILHDVAVSARDGWRGRRARRVVLAGGAHQLAQPVPVRRRAHRHAVGAHRRALRHQVSGAGRWRSSTRSTSTCAAPRSSARSGCSPPRTASPSEWCWQVALINSLNQYLCGAALIGTQWVLTAAHCVTNGCSPPRTASPSEWCWQVALINSLNQYLCGAALIGTQWVLTAAHCVTNGCSPPRTASPSEWCWQVALINSLNQYLCGAALIGTQWVLTAAHCVTKRVVLAGGAHQLAQPVPVWRRAHRHAVGAHRRALRHQASGAGRWRSSTRSTSTCVAPRSSARSGCSPPRTASPSEWCWQVALINSLNQYLCGAALIGTQWVLTAAHCVTKRVVLAGGAHQLAQPVPVWRRAHRHAVGAHRRALRHQASGAGRWRSSTRSTSTCVAPRSSARSGCSPPRTASPSEWCWQVALINSLNQYLCGAALIGTQWVLTAAHCVTKRVVLAGGAHQLAQPVPVWRRAHRHAVGAHRRALRHQASGAGRWRSSTRSTSTCVAPRSSARSGCSPPRTASPSEWCWQVALINSLNQYLCGAALIGTQWVLTAAHCVTNTCAAPRSSARSGCSPPRTASPSEWCWQVALINSLNQYLCGAALIGTQWVLTAAHCVTKRVVLAGGAHQLAQPVPVWRRAHRHAVGARPLPGPATVIVRSGEPIFVRVGDHDLTRKYGSPGAQTLRVATTYIHHNHNSQTLDNDVALLKLLGKADLKEGVCLVCLPARGVSHAAGKRCTVTGYGYMGETGPIPLRVREAELPIVSDAECIRKVNAVTEKIFILPASSFCAGGEEGTTRARCLLRAQGDGGGPLVCQDDGFYELAGLVSWGFGCGRRDVPGVYVKVSAFIGWINQIISVNNL
ncbi:hypothetical protein ACJJTC_000205 [Scirpophaga incertulas]